MRRFTRGSQALAFLLACWGAVVTAVAQVEPYIQAWEDHSGSTLEDVGTDLVSDQQGYSCVVGWITNSGTKTSYRLRILAPDGDLITSDTWGPNNGIHKAYAVAIQQTTNTATNPDQVTTNIFVTGETHTTSDGQDVGTLKYVWVRAADGTNDLISFSGPSVHKYDGPNSGDDAGLDIACVPELGWVIATGYADCGSSGLGSITMRYDAGVNFLSEGSSYYKQHLYNNGTTTGADDVTVNLSLEPDHSVCVAGYTQNGDDDDYLLLRLDMSDGSLTDGWQYDSGYDERANAVTAQGSNGIFVTGWTNSPLDPVEDEGRGGLDPVNVGPNYFTIRYDSGEEDPIWASLYNGSGNDADIAYSLSYSAANEDDTDPQNPVAYPAALAVGGAATGDGTGFDYCVVMYDPADGSIMSGGVTDWNDAGDGVFNNSLNGPDECFAVGTDLVPGHVYATGRTWKTNSAVNSFDGGTLRFMRQSGDIDNNGHNDGFPKFFFNGSANGDDSLSVLHVHSDGNSDEQNPDIFVTGYTSDTSAQENIRTIMYHDTHRDP